MRQSATDWFHYARCGSTAGVETNLSNATMASALSAGRQFTYLLSKAGMWRTAVNAFDIVALLATNHAVFKLKMQVSTW